MVPTIEPPGFEVGHFFITSRSRLPIGSGDLGSVVVLFAAMSKSETVVRGTNVRCSTCRHIQWVPVDKTAFACERCDAQLTRRQYLVGAAEQGFQHESASARRRKE